MSDEQGSRDWKDTIRLPATEFSMKADLALREPDTVARWRTEDLYGQMMKRRADAPLYVLHDGPPYANGTIHHGHALNKILKDFVVKYRNLAGFRTPYIPGWDCHGLPIEQKVDEQLGKAKQGMSKVEIRAKCREYAGHWAAVQSRDFQRLLVLADWDRPYLTMSYDYEATTVREIGRFMEQGYVYNGLKPVHWSWSAVTALAEAEVEYDAYTAPSVYVRFALPVPPDWLAELAGGRLVDVVIWTTTPWTLPSNLAIALNPDLDYELLALDDGHAIVVAHGLKESVFKACRLPELPVLGGFRGERLVGPLDGPWPRHQARHPFLDRDSVLLPAAYVTLEQGTGCVHTAPGHGHEDFQTGLKFGLPILAPVDQYGKYTAEVPDYAGKHVFAANPEIAQRLEDTGRLLNKAGDTYFIERYPYCWRTRKPLIFRATAQWFISVDHLDLRRRSLDAIGETRWIPKWGENRIRGMLEGRPDWCISRQRVWGVPIPAFECSACGKHVVSHLVANHVADLTAQGGADVWFERTPAELVPDGFTCACGAGPEHFAKVNDILDVWFDSGVSWAAVLRDREGLGSTADLYLEGSDQHRGWFHTSLLAAMGSTGAPPFRTVLTHGFVVDEHGHKYSKSSPKFEPLDRMINANGAEVLRLWVSMVDYRNDMVLAPDLLGQAGNAYRKIRNTVRYMLGALGDFVPGATPDPATLPALDRWALSRTAEFVEQLKAAYEDCEFHTVYHLLYEFCGQTLSAVYLDVLKDRLYCDAEDSAARRASQSAMYEILRTLLVCAAPVLSFTCDEAWQHLPKRAGDPTSVFLTDFPAVPTAWLDPAHDAEFARYLELRAQIQQLIERRRPQKKGERLPGQIGSSQEAAATLVAGPEAFARFAAAADLIAELAIVSAVDVAAGEPEAGAEYTLTVEPSTRPKCARCWNYRTTVGVRAGYPDLCDRCADVVEKLP